MYSTEVERTVDLLTQQTRRLLELVRDGAWDEAAALAVQRDGRLRMALSVTLTASDGPLLQRLRNVFAMADAEMQPLLQGRRSTCQQELERLQRTRNAVTAYGDDFR